MLLKWKKSHRKGSLRFLPVWCSTNQQQYLTGEFMLLRALLRAFHGLAQPSSAESSGDLQGTIFTSFESDTVWPFLATRCTSEYTDVSHSSTMIVLVQEQTCATRESHWVSNTLVIWVTAPQQQRTCPLMLWTQAMLCVSLVSLLSVQVCEILVHFGTTKL